MEKAMSSNQTEHMNPVPVCGNCCVLAACSHSGTRLVARALSFDPAIRLIPSRQRELMGANWQDPKIQGTNQQSRGATLLAEDKTCRLEAASHQLLEAPNGSQPGTAEKIFLWNTPDDVGLESGYADRVQSVPESKVKTIHVVRDPTHALSRLFERDHVRPADILPALVWQYHVVSLASVERPSNDWLTVHFEDLLARPRRTMKRMFRFLGHEARTDVLDRVASVVSDRRTRRRPTDLPEWLRAHVEEMIRRHGFLHRYSSMNEHLPVRVGKSPIHGRGCFALRHIRAGELIGIYAGPRVRRDGCYVLWNWCGRRWKGTLGRNKLRFLNHSRRPNAAFSNDVELYALQDICPSEEITFDYGEEWAAIP